MENDKDLWPKFGPTGDAEEDERRSKELLRKLERIIKDHNLGVSEDLFPDAGRVRPPDSKRKFAKDRKVVMFAFAFGLDVPEELASKYLGPDMPEDARQELESKYPPRPATEEELRARAKRFEDKDIPF
ncbi:hypothetical protein [uncultured Tateyamaria sp.]|uniref:hypothetical protein n=1 Tax=uncultured Tateyamaria sp. TaxID=455651 RepID=UPI00262F0934|nr:hypothetical protein [uncultured Tateyamaria sp.]